MTSAREAPDGHGFLSQARSSERLPGAPPGEVRLVIEGRELHDALRELHDAGARFITLFVAEMPELLLCAVLAHRGELLVLQARPGEDGLIDYREVGHWWPAAAWAERELQERDPRIRCARPPGRRPRQPTFTQPDADLLTRELHGLDVFTIPYGPVRSGVFEAIQFVVETGGENVPRLHTRPFFKHRGIEARFAGLAPEVAVHVAERVAGIASCAHATAFSQAVERALEVQPPPRAQAWRVVHCELERIACHLDVIAKEAETTGLAVGLARFLVLKEQVQRLRACLTGSRFGRGVILPGGVRAEPTMDLDQLSAGLGAIERDLGRDRRLFLGTASMTDRLINAGYLDRDVVERYGAVGPLARGSAVATDARHERPYGNYRRLGVGVVVRRSGDCMARIEVRFGELSQSLRLLRQVTEQLRRSDGELLVPLPRLGSGTACGWAEAPQGELLHWVEISDGLLRRVHIASPSLRNWALFDHAFPKDVLTDFAFIEHSFGLTPAGADR